MEYLQYSMKTISLDEARSFKPYYKWNTFNTNWIFLEVIRKNRVLNLIINGIPSILGNDDPYRKEYWCFKPYYKWITFNTKKFKAD